MQEVKSVTTHKNRNEINVAHRVEKYFSHSYIFLKKTEDADPTIFAKVVAELRVYITPTGATSVCLWVRDFHKGFGASGRVGSNNVCGGFHKPSAALSNALRMAGYEMAEEVSGVGEAAMIDAVKAVLRHLGVYNVQLIEAHG